MREGAMPGRGPRGRCLVGVALCAAVLPALVTPNAATSLPVAGGESAAVNEELEAGPGRTGVLTSVVALASDDVWAVGYRGGDIEAGKSKTLTMHWDGTRWGRVPAPHPGAFGQSKLTGVTATLADDAWAVGWFVDGGSHFRALVLHWDGSVWGRSRIPQPVGIRLQSVSAAAPDDVWATGFDDSVGAVIEHWDGARWTRMVAPNPGNVANLSSVAALSPADVWAVGTYQEAGTFFLLTLTEHWDGKRWDVVDSVDRDPKQNWLEGVAATPHGDVWSVGWWGGDGGGGGGGGGQLPTKLLKRRQFTLAEHWTGTEWQETSTPRAPSPAQLNSVTALAKNDVWAVGTQAGGTDLLTLTEHWDGQAWRRTKSPTPQGTGYLLSVEAAASSDVWAVGYSVFGTIYQTWIQRWDGNVWKVY